MFNFVQFGKLKFYMALQPHKNMRQWFKLNVGRYYVGPVYPIGTVGLVVNILSVNWRHITDLVSAKGKTKEVYCCDIVVLIVLFWCFWCVKDYKVESVYWNIVRWGCESISINYNSVTFVFPFAKIGHLTSIDRENCVRRPASSSSYGFDRNAVLH